MTKKKVYITGDIPRNGIDMLRENYHVEVFDSEAPITEDVLKEKIKGCDGLVSMVGDPVTSDVIEESGNLKVIANYGVGYDNIDVDRATQKGIKVTNTPGVLHETTADLTFSLILGVMRRTVESDKFLRDNNFKGWKPQLFLGNDVYGKRLGIIGMGEIGEAVAKRARGFEMDVLYNKRTPLSGEEENRLGVKYSDIEDIVKTSDIITLHVPLTKETKHLFTKEEFKKMKDDAYLINTARGPVVKEDDLVWALENREIKGAGLDVFEEEPKVHPGLMNREDCVLLPHIGSATEECRQEMAEIACKNVIKVLEGNKPITPVN
ncbi:2-hydroxyacid dehydrogenase [Natranaerofaba carboxydovora]|uniref:2-hydroxyacid dehydrogenase n=1 Tax=Natranaerofaba carboxydovora TaxID=2742683 RepID=UPI001F148E34|nr:D-glycerate dehydrogenase [Natranaerofaba carboxydovora]UMZ72648.1 Putative 2-hydroxyacid dehydrogenase [Natranaerofaba carboxydovora]